MLHAILITGNSFTQRLLLAQKLSSREIKLEPDSLLIDSEPSIGISVVKPIAFFLNRKPMILDKKIVFIGRAEKLTPAAQNALLKILEEPPLNSLIILTAPRQEQLLPTVVSRCSLYLIPEVLKSDTNEAAAACRQITSSKTAEKISLAAVYGQSKDKAVSFCQDQLIYLRKVLIDQKQYQLAALIRQVIKTITDLTQNVNPKLCLENLFLNYTNATFISHG